MEYLVLARKYRPKTFTSMMGQEHVLKALANALETGRLHHAYLFTGTRGVGKTTIARVLAKALNCEQGITASPCGECAACLEIDQGRFVDLIEVDAASRTRVEDTRELLENVQYAPTRGRFKIYLIDEVHMLSGHSFNALLKTLEEPPPHVKFLLATTDPQKLPVTILSRCLQFNLKRLSIEQIEQQMQNILQAESINYEQTVLKPLAIAADGSMRDALSLLDQAIAYCDGHPNLSDVEAMLGSVRKDRIYTLLAALANNNGAELIAQSRRLAEQGLDVNVILAELINSLQRIALCQMVPGILDDSYGDKQAVEQFAQAMSAEDVQLYYQIALTGRKDLPYSPQPQGGFEMILLRMLAFRPVAIKKNSVSLKKSTATANSQVKAVTVDSEPEKLPDIDHSIQKIFVADASVTVASVPVDNPPMSSDRNTNTRASSADKDLFIIDAPVPDEADIQDLPPLESYESYGSIYSADEQSEQSVSQSVKEVSPAADSSIESSNLYHTAEVQVEPSAGLNNKPEQEKQQGIVAQDKKPAVETQQKKIIPCQKSGTGKLADFWCNLIEQSQINGFEQQLAKHCALSNKTEQDGRVNFELLLESVHNHLLSDKIKQRLQVALQKVLEQPLVLHFLECQLSPKEQIQTPRRREILADEALQKEAVESIYSDQKVQMLVDSLGASIREESIKPLVSVHP